MVPVIDCTIRRSAVIKDAISVIETARKSIAVVLDEQGRVFGTISDGDIRRALLAGHTVASSVLVAVNREPLTASVSLSDLQQLRLLEASNLEAMPLVDDSGQYQRVVHRSDLTGQSDGDGKCNFETAVIMAGGEGRRLLPLTQERPKPMLDIGGAPLLERQIQRLTRVGISRIYLSINYLGHMIEEHFGDGARFGVHIQYLRETKKLGTGGALSMLPEQTQGTLLVINGDILTRSDFKRLGSFHHEHGALITVGAINHHVDIPFGVIDAEGYRVTAVREKPSQRFLCNAGIYAVSCEALALVPKDSFLNMTDLVEIAIQKGETVAVFPIYEFWSDVGTPADLERARRHVEMQG